MRLILASASPRRAELLTAAGFEFDIVRCDVDESVHAGEAPDAYVRRLALAKSARAQELLETQGRQGGQGGQGRQSTDQPPVVLAADTAVVVDGQILGKPADEDDARDMLRRLSGRRHDVLTGISLRQGSHEAGGVEHTGVYFSAIGDDEIEWYVKSGEGADKAGGYAVQGLAARYVWRIEGSYSNVVGLPVETVYQLLRSELGRTES